MDFQSRVDELLNEIDFLENRIYALKDEIRFLTPPKKITNNLIRLKAMPYGDYLTTTHWIRKRGKKLRESGKACEICSSRTKVQVHHKHYKTVGEENMSDLIVLCTPCHKLFHGKLPPAKK